MFFTLSTDVLYSLMCGKDVTPTFLSSAETTDVHSELIPQYDSLFKHSVHFLFFYIYLFISEKVLTHQLTDSSTHIVHPQALQQAGQKMAMFHGHMVHSTVH